MSSTVLQLIQQASQEMGIGSPTSVIGNQQDAVVQNLALINAVGNELCRQFDWQRITKEYLFTTVFYAYTGTTTEGSATITNLSSIVGISDLFMATGPGINQSSQVVSAAGNSVVMNQAASASGTDVSITFSQTKYAFPSDYDRLIDRTEWGKSRHWENLGPETGQQWQWLKSGFISTGPRSRFRPLGGYFQIWPPLSTADLMGFEYVSNQWVVASGDFIPSKSSFTVDTDTCVFPDRLMALGLKSMFFTVKGFSNIYEDQYAMQLNIAKSNDAGSPTLSMAPRLSDQLITVANIPDSGYGNS